MNAPLRPKKKTSTLIVYGVLALLAISLTGFGVRSVGQGRAQAIATVGKEKVTVNTYARTLRGQLRALSQRLRRNITMEEARNIGLDRQVLAQVLATAALDNEDARLGLSVGDIRVRNTLLATRGFQGLDGKFSDSTYKSALKQAGLKPAEYDTIVRKNLTRSILQSGVTGGIKGGGVYARALLDFVGEDRTFDWAPVTKAMLASPTRAPSEAEITAYYKANPKTYTSLQTRKITYVLLTPDMVIPTIKISNAALKKLYDSQSSRYHIPGRREVDRLVFGTMKEAQAAMAEIRSGKKTFKEIVNARELSLKDVDMGEVSRDTLSAAAGKAVFALTKPGLVGPVASSLGDAPAIFQVNAVLAAQNTTFDEAKKALTAELAADKAQRQIDSKAPSISDSLAGGAVLEDIAKNTPMVLGKIDFTAKSDKGIAAFAKFRKAAQEAKVKDYPQVADLANGGIFAFRVDKIIPPTLRPLDKVRAQVIADWTLAETHKRVVALADKLKSRIKAGESFAKVGLTPVVAKDIRRQSKIEGAPVGLVEAVFTAKDQGVGAVVEPANVAIFKVTKITPFNPKKPENATAIANLNQRYAQQVGDDVYAAFANAIENKAGVTINQALVNSVNSQIR